MKYVSQDIEGNSKFCFTNDKTLVSYVPKKRDNFY